MTGQQRSQKMTRRQAIRRIGAAAAGVAGAAKLCAGEGTATSRPATGPSPAGGLLVERGPNGVEIRQVTVEPFDQSVIYCEIPYCSRDSRSFVYERVNRELKGANRTELMLVELGTWKQHLLDVCTRLSGSAISHDGVFYYLKARPDGRRDLMRVDLAKGSPEPVYSLPEEEPVISHGTISCDGRRYAYGTRLDPEYRLFGITLVDLEKGTATVIDRDPFILNPHPQFEPGESKLLLIQHNRGGKYSPEGKLERLVGPEGATLYLLSVSDGRRTPLQVGLPFTTPATGHEAWIGRTGEVLLSVLAHDDHAPEKGSLLAVGAGRPARRIGRGYAINHVNVSPCGRFFCCDDWRGTCKIVIGSILTGKSTVVCESRASMKREQNTHPHAYLTPDLKWVIFNSDRSGTPHVHAARIPEEIIADLSAT